MKMIEINLQESTNVSSRGSNIILSNSNFEKIENDRVINNPKIDEIRTYQSDRTL